MFVLDPEYQSLIKMRYLLREGNVINMDDLVNKVRKLVVDSKTLQEIADDISDFKQDGDISRSSVGRWFGKYAIQSNISRSNLDVIAKYLLCEDWSEVVNHNIEDLEQRIFKEHNLAVAEQLVSMDSKIDNDSFGLQRIISHNIEKGKIIEVKYGKHNKIIKLKKIDNTDRYLIMYCDSKVLGDGWSLIIPAILLGVNIIGLDIKENGIAIKSIYKSGGTVTYIKIINSIWEM